jgi:hypothetical protein
MRLCEALFRPRQSREIIRIKILREAATGSPQLKRSKSRTFAHGRDKNARTFKEAQGRNLVRDVGVAGQI